MMVNNLPHGTKAVDIRALVSQYGKVRNVNKCIFSHLSVFIPRTLVTQCSQKLLFCELCTFSFHFRKKFLNTKVFCEIRTSLSISWHVMNLVAVNVNRNIDAYELLC